MGIQFKQVTKRYGGTASPLVVQGIDFVVPKGSLTTILGPSGCGKTTTLRMIAGLEAPTGGQILIDGVDVTHLGPSERNVSMVFQSYALFPHMNVVENVMYGLRMSGQPKEQARAKAVEALRGVGLVGFDDRLPSELSGGQQQRVALARAWALRAEVLLLDEPTSSLDPHAKREVEALMAEFALSHDLGHEPGHAKRANAQPVTMVFSSHNLGQVKRLASRVVYLEHGRLVADLPTHDFFNGPLPEAARLFVKGELV